MTRPAAYRWLSTALGIAHVTCHIGLMTREQAERTVKLSRLKLEDCRRAKKEAAASPDALAFEQALEAVRQAPPRPPRRRGRGKRKRRS